MTERTRSRPSTVTAIVAPGAAALLSAATAFALHHSPAPAPKASPVQKAAPATRADDVALARLRSQTRTADAKLKTADAELKRLRAELAQVNSELAKANSAPIQLPRVDAGGASADVVPAAIEVTAPPAGLAPAPAAPAPAAPAPAAPAPPPPPPVDASTGAS